jgi:hypothetical protein
MPHPAQWRYRVTVPRNENLTLKYVYSGISESGIPQQPHEVYLPSSTTGPVEVVIDAFILFEDGNAYLCVGYEALSERVKFHEFASPAKILPSDHYFQHRLPGKSTRDGFRTFGLSTIGDGRAGPGWELQAMEPKQPLVLLRFRGEPDKDSSDGLMIWLENRP